MDRRLGALACIGFVSLLGGCGDGPNNDLLSETGVRECLAKENIRVQPASGGQGGSKGYAPVYAADFTAYTADGAAVDVVIQHSADRARATAADVRSALRSFGPASASADERVVSAQNAVAVFSRTESAADRAAVRRCLAG